jgi:hypothetical protein
VTDPATRTALETMLDDFAAQLEDVEATTDAGIKTWRHESMSFAILGAAGVDLRLSPRVAAAAVATPDTDPSPRGPEWITFHPPELDDQALDRLEAWFELAWRHAAPSARSN